ncbi:MAG TPA: ABC transporter substrate-binding protein, partial [Acidimicrobiales bacterium]|nr:ABC transporter substrate-binding protein [Acidimicrobiales bacterium]HJP25408.1 ABC transporter substrate-binding protein [Acidimicrobiales bacterium]
QLAMYVDIDGMEPEDAAALWLADNCARWTGWASADQGVCPEAPVAAETLYDYGVTDDTIRIGAIADLSGIFAPLVIQIIDAQTSYWDMVNDHGGIDGKQVEFVVLDNGYDVPTHLERYEAMKDKDSGVVFLSQSTGSPHTAAIAEALVEDGLGAIPLSWYSGWPDPAFGQNVFESYTNYCYESMNAVDWLSNNVVEGDTKLAVISYPGEYGQDGATGAKMAAEALGIEVVYDGEGAAIPGADQTPVIAGLIESGANLVWATVGPGVFAEIFGGAAAQGFMPIWSGNSPTYNYVLLATPLAPALDAVYYQSSYVPTWNTGGTSGMETMVAELQARIPDKPLSDVYAVGWTEAMATHQILETAANNKDMTRAGVIVAANETVVDYQGLAPNQGYGGEVNDFIVRESYIFDIQADLFDAEATVAGGGSTGSVMLGGGPIMSDQARDHVYEGACFSAG